MDQHVWSARARAYREYLEQVARGLAARAGRVPNRLSATVSAPLPGEFVSHIRQESEAALAAAREALAQPTERVLPERTDVPPSFPPPDLLFTAAGDQYEPAKGASHG